EVGLDVRGFEPENVRFAEPAVPARGAESPDSPLIGPLAEGGGVDAEPPCGFLEAQPVRHGKYFRNLSESTCKAEISRGKRPFPRGPAAGCRIGGPRHPAARPGFGAGRDRGAPAPRPARRGSTCEC